jgi:hypothetical protein
VKSVPSVTVPLSFLRVLEAWFGAKHKYLIEVVTASKELEIRREGREKDG